MKPEAATACYADVRDGILTIGNSRIERKWTLDSAGVVPLSVLDRQRNTEWLEQKAASTAPAFRHPAITKFADYEVRQQPDNDNGRAPDHLLVHVTAVSGSFDMCWSLRIYPDVPLIRQTVFIRKSDQSSVTDSGGEPLSIEYLNKDLYNNGATERNAPKPVSPTDYMDFLAIAPLHCRWEAIQLHDVTDTNNNLVTVKEGLLYTDKALHPLSGNYLSLRNNVTKDGLLLVKESPTSFGQLLAASDDFCVSGRRLWVTGSGVSEQDLQSGEWVECYGSAVGIYHGDELERLRLIRHYHACLQSYSTDGDCYIMSNTWGDRSRDGRITESFILRELEQASRLGITHVQIDDGWQKGATSNSIIAGGTWADYYSKHADFWDVHPERFPNGLAPVVQRAEQLNIRLGLWFSPDSNDDFAHWEKDVEVLYRLWNDYGVRYFKLDGISIRNKLGESRFLRILSETANRTSGNIYFNLDTTNGKRLGYLYHTSGGNLFLENRYTDFNSYYPHWTLRNIWMLSPYVPAGKLQMEFLNTERNTAIYKDDPLSPSMCGIGYSFAVTMFASPLAWMELSGLSDQQVETLKPLIALFNRIKSETGHGHVLPIGEQPSGTGWTGLQCMTGDKEGYLLAFREYTREDTGTFRLWGSRSASTRLECLVRSEGRQQMAFPGTIERTAPSSTGEIRITLTQPLSFALYRYSGNE
ncbi:hypothetical protein FE784_16915 [Paenibacillus hemerocallicola]|uniref:Alpha-galactosidase n=1 Tax=Paenibacillus hemerocallicola TaxID=1172614 RepID=A0A5C4T9I8_9BACL|nr:alpha-galactosidase [Paenibacillus hemerocallicola]TNJ65067.1 hypothetical protein FE784_16915 [Paenibacillus hemerocallicola]